MPNKEELKAKLAELEGINIEESGNWVWISGETRQHKETLKKLGCRWSKKRTAWYWKPAAGSSEAKAPEELDVEAIRAEYSGEYSDGYMGATRWDGNHSKEYLYGAKLSKALREAFKKCRIHGVTVSSSTYAGGQSVTVKIKAQPEDFRSFEEFEQEEKFKPRDHEIDLQKEYDWYKEGFSLNHYYLERYESILSTPMMKKIRAIKAIVDSYNYDDSNGMVDYFNRGFYESYYIKVA